MNWNRLVVCEFRRGIIRKVQLLAVLQFLFLSFFFWISKRNLAEKPLLGDYLFYFFCGIPPIQNNQSGTFSLPTMWLQIFACALYVNLSYPLCDLTKEGEQILVRCGSRRKWYMSKCIWNLSASIAYYLSAVLSANFMTLITGGNAVLDFHPDFFIHLTSASYRATITVQEKLLAIVVLPVTAIAAINMLQMTLSFIFKPVYAFITCMTVLIAGIFFASPFLVGNNVMLLRSSLLFVDSTQISAIHSVITNILTISLCIPIGMNKFKDYDILPTVGKE